jgi:PAS domain S-box-containing protein
VEARLTAVLRIEKGLLVTRYLAMAAAIAGAWLGNVALVPAAWALLSAALLAQAAFVHYTLGRRRYNLFFSPTNFGLHFVGVALIVLFTGAEESILATLYSVLIIAYCIYSRNFRGTYPVTLLCAGTFTVSFTVHAIATGSPPKAEAILLNLGYMLVCGLLMDTLGRRIRDAEAEASLRAQALASSEATLRTILDSTPGPILVYDEDEFVTEANDGACEFLGVARESVVGRRFRGLLFDDGTLSQKLANLRSRGWYRGEALLVTDDGVERSVDLRIRSFIRDDHRFNAVILHDITAQKDVQESARVSTLKLEEINLELQRVNELRAAFFSTVSQRLRSPLTAILGFTDLLLNEDLGELNAKQRRTVQSCRRSVMRAFSLVDNASSQDQAPPARDSARTGE